jgi:DNA topoisomerase-1
LAGFPACKTEGEAKRNVNTCIKAVAGVLGNTPAVCRKAYIDPAVLEAYQAGELTVKPGESDRAFETGVLRFLETARRKPATARKPAKKVA